MARRASAELAQFAGAGMALLGIREIYEPAALIVGGLLIVLYVEGRRNE